MRSLEGQCAIVTGSSRGIGKAIAIELARNGARVVLNYFEAEHDGLKALEELTGMGFDVKLYHADISDYAQAVSLMDFAQGAFGPVSILVNNAGIVKDRAIKNLDLDDWDRVLKVNLTGTFICTKLAAQQMIEEKYGRIVNISSIVGLAGNFGQANYSASKAGVIGLTMTAALELAKYGITVNAVAPGFVNTSMTKSLPKEVLDKVIERTPMKRLGTPEDISNAVLFLVSKESMFITGQVIEVNGGLHMR